MKLTITEKTMPVFNFIKENDGKNLTAADIAIGMGMCDADDDDAVKAACKSVNAIVTAGLQRKGYTERVKAEIENAEGLHEIATFIQLTDAGRAYNHEEAVKTDIAAAMKK